MRRLWRNLLILAAIPPTLVLLLLLVIFGGGAILYYSEEHPPPVGSEEYFEQLLGVRIKPEEIYYCDNFPTFSFDGSGLFMYKLSYAEMIAIRSKMVNLPTYPRLRVPEGWGAQGWFAHSLNATEKRMFKDLRTLGINCLEIQRADSYPKAMVHKIIDNCTEGRQVFFAYKYIQERGIPLNFVLYVLNMDQRILIVAPQYW
jgi:hypothetical protein